MNSKEKAWELYNDYRTLEGKFGDKVLYNYDAKQCALKTVNEISKHCYEVMKPFWEEVKQELQKL